jgi:hypothetical protein
MPIEVPEAVALVQPGVGACTHAENKSTETVDRYGVLVRLSSSSAGASSRQAS